MNIKNIESLKLGVDAFGLNEGVIFERENDLFVCEVFNMEEGDGFSYSRREVRKYSSEFMQKHIGLFQVVEYTAEYENQLQREREEDLSIKDTVKPFKSRKKIRAQIAEYEKRLEALENGETKFYSAADKHEARTVWFNLIKALKWTINEDEQVC